MTETSSEGDRREAEFSVFYRDTFDALRAYAYALAPGLDTEAVANEACARTFKQWELIKGSHRAWAFRVAHNLVRRSYRTKPAIPLPPGSLPDRPSSRFSRPDVSYELRELLEAIQSFPPSLREPMLLAAQQLEPQEIAVVLNLNPRTVSKYLYRARARLLQLGLLDRKPPVPPEHTPSHDELDRPPGCEADSRVRPDPDHAEHTGTHHA